MPEFGFPAQPQMSRMSRLIANMRTTGDDAQIAAVTGRPADLATHLDGRVNEAVLIGKGLADLQGYNEAIALSEARAGVMQQSMSQLVDLGQDLTSSVDKLLTNGTDSNFQTVSADGQAMLGSLVSALNVQFAGRSLFAGDEGTTNAIADAADILTLSVPIMEAETTASDAYTALETTYMTAAALFDTSIYLGGAGDPPRTEIAQGEVVDYSVKADEDAFKRLIFNTVVIGAAYDPNNSLPDPIRKDLIDTNVH